MSSRKKPAKAQSSTKQEQLGKAVLVWNLGDKRFKCHACTRSFRRGMTYEHENRAYCSRRCIKRTV